MCAQQQRGLVAALALHGFQNFRVLLIGGVNRRLLGEIEPADDADALGHVAVDASHLGVAGGGDQRTVKGLVPRGDLHHLGTALRHRHQPDRNQLRKHLGVDALTIRTQPLHRRGLSSMRRS